MRSDEGSDHVKRMKNDRVAKRVYVGEYAGNHEVFELQKKRFGC